MITPNSQLTFRNHWERETLNPRAGARGPRVCCTRCETRVRPVQSRFPAGCSWLSAISYGLSAGEGRRVSGGTGPAAGWAPQFPLLPPERTGSQSGASTNRGHNTPMSTRPGGRMTQVATRQSRLVSARDESCNGQTRPAADESVASAAIDRDRWIAAGGLRTRASACGSCRSPALGAGECALATGCTCRRSLSA
jgi:hypothetical protein